MIQTTWSSHPEPALSVSDYSLASITDIPDYILRTELARRNEARDLNNDKAACGSKEKGAYNTPIHVMALFLILVLSTLACSFPVLARRFPRLPIPRHFLFLSRHFGTGVLIATAFVHLLPTAFVSLTDPCLPRFWSESYRAMAGFVAMISVFVVVVVEMFFAMKGAGHVHGSEYDHLISTAARDSIESMSENADYSRLDSHNASDDLHLDIIQPDSQADISQSKPGSSPRISSEHKHRQDRNPLPHNGADAPDLENSEPINNYHSIRGVRDSNSHCHDPQSQELAGQANPNFPLQSLQRQLLQCLLLEAGILFHSIFIGMALSVATGTSFVVLLVAICFHQTFEGFALGSRIASLIPDLFPPSSMKPWLMSLAYGMTTPVGQAIGLFLHNLYDPASTAGLLMVGITNAISSGLLLFAGLVELLAEDFLSESSYVTLRGRRRVEACVAVASGALLMALVGAFA